MTMPLLSSCPKISGTKEKSFLLFVRWILDILWVSPLKAASPEKMSPNRLYIYERISSLWSQGTHASGLKWRQIDIRRSHSEQKICLRPKSPSAWLCWRLQVAEPGPNGGPCGKTVPSEPQYRAGFATKRVSRLLRRGGCLLATGSGIRSSRLQRHIALCLVLANPILVAGLPNLTVLDEGSFRAAPLHVNRRRGFFWSFIIYIEVSAARRLPFHVGQTMKFIY